MCFTHLRRVPADDAATFGWVSSILLLSPIFSLLLTQDSTPGSTYELRKAREMSRQIFAMSSGSLRTPRGLGLPEDTVRQVELLNFLNFLALLQTLYAVRDRAEALASLHSYRDVPRGHVGLEQRDSGIGVYRQPRWRGRRRESFRASPTSPGTLRRSGAGSRTGSGVDSACPRCSPRPRRSPERGEPHF